MDESVDAFMDDHALVREFAESNSEAAFRSLVDRHLPLVFGLARQITRDESLAQDIAQTVFLTLAQKARALSKQIILSGWLFRTTHFVSMRAMRTNQRRRCREQTAISMHFENSTIELGETTKLEVDSALARLGESDRDVLILRYLEGEEIPVIAQKLQITEEAAKKRIHRALQRIRMNLPNRGQRISLAGVVTALSIEGRAAVPEGLRSAVVSQMSRRRSPSVGFIGSVFVWMRSAKVMLVSTALLIGIGLTLWQMPNHLGKISDSSTQVKMKSQTTPAVPALQSTLGKAVSEVESEIILEKLITVRVLDRVGDQPIAGAQVTHSFAADTENAAFTDAVGMAEVHIIQRKGMQGDDRQFFITINALDFASRMIYSLCTTGNVLQTIPANYTVKLERGIPISGLVLDDGGHPLKNVTVEINGSNFRGYSENVDSEGKSVSPPQIRVEDFSVFTTPSSQEGTGDHTTDDLGRFRAEHFPSDLEELRISVTTQDGLHYQFLTQKGSEGIRAQYAPVVMSELRNGTARLIVDRSATVSGLVVDNLGNPVQGAAITEVVAEAVTYPKLKIRSETLTDGRGEFHLPNRAPGKVILGATAPGYGTISIDVTYTMGRNNLRMRLPPELPLFGKVVGTDDQPIEGAQVELDESSNEALGVRWKQITDSAGQFSWLSAPTNELVLSAVAPGFALRRFRVKADMGEYSLKLVPGAFESIRLKGDIRDALSGELLDNVTVKVHSANRAGAPDYHRKTVQADKGNFSFNLNLNELEMSRSENLVLVVFADGYEQLVSGKFAILEGDREFHLLLNREKKTR